MWASHHLHVIDKKVDTWDKKKYLDNLALAKLGNTNQWEREM